MPLELTLERWHELVGVNRLVNRFAYKADLDRYDRADFWTEIDTHGGDCEDYALEKRRRLLSLGWPIDVLRLAVCVAEGEGHCVLMVDTNQGTYVLDNIEEAVTPWEKLRYRWIMRQKGRAWVRINDPHA